MIKKIAFITLTALVFLGCGDSNSDSLNNKKFIYILQDIQSELCTSDEIAQALSLSNINEFEVRRTGNDTTCETYNKIDDDFFCSIESIGGGSSNCVIGLNKRINDFSKPLEPEYIPTFKDISLLINEVL